MDGHNQPTKLYNSLVEMCVVVGMDQDTGLSPASARKSHKDKVKDDSPLFSTHYKAFVLAAVSGEIAMFPNTDNKIDGDPFYQIGAVVATPPVKKKKVKTRRSMSILPGGGAVFPVSSEVFNSLPPLCLPDGGLINKQPEDESVHYLVLTDIEGNRTYSCCLRIYKPYLAKENENVPGTYDLVYMDAANDQTAIKDSGYVQCYVPTCCCLISKYPYFEVLKNCLSSMVKGLKMDAAAFRTSIMQYISQLAMVPIPPPGSLGIEFNLNGVSHFVKPTSEPEMRIVDLDLRYPFLCFSLDDVLLLISCVLTQKRLVFVSSKYALLTLIIESIFTFIQPFSWSWTYVPVLPSNLIDLVEAPGVYILGCHISLRDKIERVMSTQEMADIIIVNIDKGTINKGENVILHSIPSHISAHFKDWMKKCNLSFDLMAVSRPSFSSVTDLKAARNSFVQEFQSVVLTASLEMMARMFSDITTSKFSGGELYFNLDAFIESKPEEDQPFYKEVCETHAFRSFLEDRISYPDKRDYFSAMTERVRPHMNRQGALRKRSSSLMASVAASQKSTSNNHSVGFHSMSTLSLPPFNLEGMYTGNFYDECLTELTARIKDHENSSSLHLGNYLYLRGMFNVARGNRIEGLDDFFAVISRNVQLFPGRFVEIVLSALTEEEGQILQNKSYYAKAKQIKNKIKEVEYNRRERKQVVTSARPSRPLDKEMFTKRVIMLEIATTSTSAIKLFEALTLYRQNDVVDPDVFSNFYGALCEADREAESLSLIGITVEPGEIVIIVSSLIRTDRGMGRLIVTNKRLVFKADGTHKCETVIRIEDIQDVEKYQYYVVLPPGVAALKITSKNKCKSPFIACLKDDRNFWCECIKEMVAGYKISAESKDKLSLKQASQNVMIAEALRKSDNSDMATSHVLFLNKVSIQSKKLSDETKKMLEGRIDPNPQAKESEKTTVESMVYVPTGDCNGEVWCGLGSGAVVVIETKTWNCISMLRHAKDRVSCLQPVGNDHIWVGSMDTTIYIINRITKQADQQLHGHHDYISYMVTTKDDDGSVTVWSASLEGLIIGWDPVALTIKKTIKLNVITLTSIISVGDTFWCVTRSAVLIVDKNSDGSGYKSLSTYSEKDLVRSIDCMCFVPETNKIWTGCDKKGLIAVWDVETYSPVIHDVTNKGFTQMIHISGGKVWAGGRDGTVFIFNAENCQLEKSLELHEDKIRSMCLTEDAFLLTGPGSRDGRIAVWRTHLSRETIDEPDFEVVNEGVIKLNDNNDKKK